MFSLSPTVWLCLHFINLCNQVPRCALSCLREAGFLWGDCFQLVHLRPGIGPSRWMTSYKWEGAKAARQGWHELAGSMIEESETSALTLMELRRLTEWFVVRRRARRRPYHLDVKVAVQSSRPDSEGLAPVTCWPDLDATHESTQTRICTFHQRQGFLRMRFSPRLLASAAEFRKPSIHFLGRRKWPSGMHFCRAAMMWTLTPNNVLVPEPPHPHPAAPKEYQTSSFFTDFQKKSTSSPQPSQSPSQTQKASPSNTGAYTEFWQAPSRIWQPRVHKLSEEEIDAIQVRIKSTVFPNPRCWWRIR